MEHKGLIGSIVYNETFINKEINVFCFKSDEEKKNFVYWAKTKNVNLYVDIENGMYFTDLKILIGLIFKLKDKVVITTNSKEVLEIIANHLPYYDEIDERYRVDQEISDKTFQYFNAKTYKNDETVFYPYDNRKFKFLLENGNEIR